MHCCDKQVCLSVCLSANISQKPHKSKLHQLFSTCYLWPWLDRSLSAMQYNTLCTSSFVIDVSFHIMKGMGQNHPVHQMASPVKRQTTLFGGDCQVTASAAKSAISDWILILPTSTPYKSKLKIYRSASACHVTWSLSLIQLMQLVQNWLCGFKTATVKPNSRRKGVWRHIYGWC